MVLKSTIIDRGGNLTSSYLEVHSLHLCKQNAEEFFEILKIIVDCAVFTEKLKGNQILTMDTFLFSQKRKTKI